MLWYGLISVVLVGSGGILLSYQLFKITELDARSRGLAHPKLWDLFATGQSGGGGLLFYFISRRKHPSNMTPQQQGEMDQRKRHFAWFLSLFVMGSLGLLAMTIFGSCKVG